MSKPGWRPTSFTKPAPARKTRNRNAPSRLAKSVRAGALGMEWFFGGDSDSKIQKTGLAKGDAPAYFARSFELAAPQARPGRPLLFDREAVGLGFFIMPVRIRLKRVG